MSFPVDCAFSLGSDLDLKGRQSSSWRSQKVGSEQGRGPFKFAFNIQVSPESDSNMLAAVQALTGLESRCRQHGTLTTVTLGLEVDWSYINIIHGTINVAQRLLQVSCRD